MRFRPQTIAGIAGSIAVSAWVAWHGGIGVDYDKDARPAIDALGSGDVSGMLAQQPLMGSLSVLLRAPLAALAEDPMTAYRLGALACLVAGGLLGLWVAGLMKERGRSRGARVTVWALCAAGPMTFNAVLWGHPEEALGGALCVAAVLAAGRDRPLAAGIALGLALATKQWAVIAIVPVLLAAPGRRVVLATVAAGLALALTVPFMVGGPDSFAHNAKMASNSHTEVRPLSVWWLFAPEETRTVSDGVAMREVAEPYLPASLGRVPHPLIVLLPIPLGLLLVRRRGDADAALGLLALLLLLRCAIDPVDNGYYHVPFLMALAAWEGLRRDGLPVLSLVSATVLWVLVRHVPVEHSDATSAAYLAWAIPMVGVLARAVYRRPDAERARAARAERPSMSAVPAS
jgi:hypothetical protein